MQLFQFAAITIGDIIISYWSATAISAKIKGIKLYERQGNS